MIVEIRMHTLRKPEMTMRCNLRLADHGHKRQGEKDKFYHLIRKYMPLVFTFLSTGLELGIPSDSSLHVSYAK